MIHFDTFLGGQARSDIAGMVVVVAGTVIIKLTQLNLKFQVSIANWSFV